MVAGHHPTRMPLLSGPSEARAAGFVPPSGESGGWPRGCGRFGVPVRGDDGVELGVDPDGVVESFALELGED
jgi:hypothetical protein